MKQPKHVSLNAKELAWFEAEALRQRQLPENQKRMIETGKVIRVCDVVHAIFEKVMGGS